MPGLIPLAGAAASIAFGSTAIAYAVTIGASIAVSARQRRRARRAYNDSVRDRELTVRGADVPWALIYGETRVGGVLTYWCRHGAVGQYLSVVLTIAHHEIESVESIYFGDVALGTLDGSGYVTTGEFAPTYLSSPAAQISGGGIGSTASIPVTAGASLSSLSSIATLTDGSQDSAPTLLVEGVDFTRSGTTITWQVDYTGETFVVTWVETRTRTLVQVKKFLGIAAGERDTELETSSGNEWTSAMIGRGVARVRLTLEYDETLFAGWSPESVTFVVRGRKIYDPRSATTAWSKNPILIARDYLRDELVGFGCSSDEINDTTVAAHASICDEDVPIDGGSGTQNRFECDGVLSSGVERKSNLEAILSSCDGAAVWTGGKWEIRAAAYATPVLTLTDDDLAPGAVEFQTTPENRETFNAVRGKFRDPSRGYQLTDFVPYESSTYAAQDGETLWTDLELPMTQNAIAARRLAKIILHRARQGVTFRASWSMKAFKAAPGDGVALTVARYGWTSKAFRLLDREHDPATHSITLQGQEDAAAVYAWDYSEALEPDPSPNTDLPRPNVITDPSNVTVASGSSTFLRQADGSLVPFASASWDLPPESDVYALLHWKRASETGYQTIRAQVGDTSLRIERVAPGETLNGWLELVNGIGARSSRSFWTHTVSTSVPSTAAGELAPPAANLLANVEFKNSPEGWWLARTGGTFEIESGDYRVLSADAYITTTTFAWALDGSTFGIGNYRPKPRNALMMHDTGGGTHTRQRYLLPVRGVPIRVGDRVELQAWVAATNCNAELFAMWYDEDEVFLSSEIVAGGDATCLGSEGYDAQNSLAEFKRLWGFATAPANAAIVRFAVFMSRTVTGATVSYATLAMPFLAMAHRWQTAPSQWSAGPAGGTVEGLSRVARVFEKLNETGATIASPSRIWFIGPVCSGPPGHMCEVDVTFSIASDVGGTGYTLDAALRAQDSSVTTPEYTTGVAGAYPSSGYISKTMAQNPVITNAAGVDQITHAHLKLAFEIPAGGVLTPELWIDRSTRDATGAIVAKQTGSIGASDRIFDLTWTCTVHERSA